MHHYICSTEGTSLQILKRWFYVAVRNYPSLYRVTLIAPSTSLSKGTLVEGLKLLMTSQVYKFNGRMKYKCNLWWTRFCASCFKLALLTDSCQLPCKLYPTASQIQNDLDVFSTILLQKTRNHVGMTCSL